MADKAGVGYTVFARDIIEEITKTNGFGVYRIESIMAQNKLDFDEIMKAKERAWVEEQTRKGAAVSDKRQA